MQNARRFYSVWIWLVVILALPVLGCNSLMRMAFKDTVPVYEGTEMVDSLKRSVTISRDQMGIPFIEASSKEDLAFGMGYAHAADRLGQMIGYRLMSQGRMSEMIGPAGLEMDLFMRALNLEKMSAMMIGANPAEIEPILQSYAAGVNAYMAHNPDKLPPDMQLAGYKPEPWTARDSATLTTLLTVGLSFNMHQEINALNIIQKIGAEKAIWLFPIYPDEEIPFTEAEKLKGIDLTPAAATIRELLAAQEKVLAFTTLGVAASNNWAIHKSKTASGASILANDTHMPLSLPSLWYLVHARCPDYDAAGFGVAGLPAIIGGYNGHVAWGMTMVMGDNQDVFLEKLRMIDGRLHYLHQGQWHPTIEREEVFKVKGGKPVHRIIHATDHGPLMNLAISQPPKHLLLPQATENSFGIAMRWAANLEPDQSVTGLLRLGQSQDVGQAMANARELRAISLNILCADKDDIGWQVTGRYPLRKNGRGLLPSPGWDGAYDWTGYLPVADHPATVNPKAGYLATANDRTVPPDGPVLLSSSWHYPDRVVRIRQMIEDGTGATLEGNIRMQYDQHSLYTQRIKQVVLAPAFLAAMQQEAATWHDEGRQKRFREAVQMLERFDGNMPAQSRDALIQGALLYTYTHNTFLDELGPEDSSAWISFLENSELCYNPIVDHLTQRDDRSPFWDDVRTPQKETKAQIIARSLADAIALIEQKLGKDRTQWQWGKLHTYHFRTETTQIAKHLGPIEKYGMRALAPFFDRGPYPAGGCYTTMNVAGYHLGKDFDVWLIPEMRMLVDFSRDEPLLIVNSTGQSENPLSPHYEDGIHAWLERDYQSMPFKEDNIRKRYTRTMVLKPAAGPDKQ